MHDHQLTETISSVSCRNDLHTASCETSDIKLAFHDADIGTDFLARILADTSDTRD